MCDVVAAAVPGKNRLMARSPSAGTSSSTGSLSTRECRGMVVDAFPLNFRVRSEAGSISAASVRRAMCAPPMSKGWSPNVLEILIVTFLPPALTCTMRRRVWFRKIWACPGMAANRSRLLEAAEKTTHRYGFGNTAIADIAKQAGIPLGNVYYYFKTKDEIAESIVNLRVSRFRKLLEEFDKTDSPKQRLCAFV